MKLQVAGIDRESIVDGPGIRLVVYLQGCPHRCPGCHNQNTWDPEGGTEMEVSEILGLTETAGLIDGVTFSGGEPFCQPAPLLALAGSLKSRGLNLVLYSGYTFEQLLEIAKREPAVAGLLKTGWLLIDCPYIQQQRSLNLPYRGSRNQRLIDLSLSMKAGRTVLWNNHFLFDEKWSKIG
jgi:anaerobic ribonucleoside-triphosphate reductase activating protein